MATKQATSGKSRSKMTKEHKAALAQGREESRLVKAYLDLLEATTPRKRGRKRTPESIAKRLQTIERTLPDASSLNRLQLLQEKSDLEREAAAQSSATGPDLEAMRKGFVAVAKSYGARKGITYATWRAAGVDAATLKQAGITRAG